MQKVELTIKSVIIFNSLFANNYRLRTLQNNIELDRSCIRFVLLPAVTSHLVQCHRQEVDGAAPHKHPPGSPVPHALLRVCAVCVLLCVLTTWNLRDHHTAKAQSRPPPQRNPPVQPLQWHSSPAPECFFTVEVLYYQKCVCGS